MLFVAATHLLPLLSTRSVLSAMTLVTVMVADTLNIFVEAVLKSKQGPIYTLYLDAAADSGVFNCYTIGVPARWLGTEKC